MDLISTKKLTDHVGAAVLDVDRHRLLADTLSSRQMHRPTLVGEEAIR